MRGTDRGSQLAADVGQQGAVAQGQLIPHLLGVEAVHQQRLHDCGRQGQVRCGSAPPALALFAAAALGGAAHRGRRRCVGG